MNETDRDILEDPAKSDTDKLRSEINILKERKRSIESSQKIVPLSGLIISLVMIIAYFLFGKSLVPLCIGIFYLAISVVYPFLRITAPISEEIASLEDELYFNLKGIEAKEERAERFFKSHDIGLRLYYDQALNQTKIIFVVGIFCILVGFAFIGISFYLIYIKNDIAREINEKILIASFGTISGLLTNYVAVIYMKIYLETAKSFTVFHQKLVSSNHLHFVNFLISKIDDKQILNDTIKDISTKITEKI